ncbi:MAG TPA: MBL fold metallo-hydrolase, partial [Dehalococcoidia bacterium]|nr:MBL fold metallo-hydrolase [Dehalococcoidia bacterium]
MEITWLGHSCFRLRSRETTVVTDPPSAEKGYSLPNLTATIVTVSHGHPGHNASALCGGSPRVIEGPGEYEVGGVLIAGVRTYHDDKHGQDRGPNTAFVIELEELRLCHLGDLGHIPTAEQREAMSDIDVLMIPVGGHSTIDGAGAAEVASLLEPKIVIPMHYRTDLFAGELEP